MVHKKVIEDILLKSIMEITGKCPRGYVSPKYRLSAFNPKDYTMEEYGSDQDPDNTKNLPENKYTYHSPIGRLQKIQEDLQDKINYTNVDKGMAEYWSFGGSMDINLSLLLEKQPDKMKFSEVEKESYSMDRKDPYKIEGWDEHHPEDLDKDVDEVGWYPMFKKREIIKFMDELIEKSPRLQENCVMYRCGSLPTGLKVGDYGVLDCFSSCTFNPYVAEKAIRKMPWVKKKRYNIRIFAPQGTKGFVPYEGLDCEDWQSEWVLPRGQRFILLNRDTKTRPPTADILLY